VFVAAVDVIEAADLGGALGGERGGSAEVILYSIDARIDGDQAINGRY
jgi:hypothetical protein